MHAFCKSPSAARSFDLHPGGVPGVFKKGRGDGESGGGRWPTVGGRSQAANWQPARGGGREVLIGLDGGGGSRTYLRQDLHPHAFSPPTF